MKYLSMAGKRISCITFKHVVVYFPCSNLLMCDLQVTHVTDLIGDVKGTVLLLAHYNFYRTSFWLSSINVCFTFVSWFWGVFFHNDGIDDIAFFSIVSFES